MAQKITPSIRLERAWREWSDAIAGLGDADFELLVYHQWNLKDVMGHVFSYLRLALDHVQSYQKRKRLASPRAPSYSFLNRREAARLKRVPLAQPRGFGCDASRVDDAAAGVDRRRLEEIVSIAMVTFELSHDAARLAARDG